MEKEPTRSPHENESMKKTLDSFLKEHEKNGRLEKIQDFFEALKLLKNEPGIVDGPIVYFHEYSDGWIGEGNMVTMSIETHIDCCAPREDKESMFKGKRYFQFERSLPRGKLHRREINFENNGATASLRNFIDELNRNGISFEMTTGEEKIGREGYSVGRTFKIVDKIT